MPNNQRSEWKENKLIETMPLMCRFCNARMDTKNWMDDEWYCQCTHCKAIALPDFRVVAWCWVRLLISYQSDY